MAEMRWTPAQADAIRSRGKSIAVSAAAGSGKTAVLTRRIIERVCDPETGGDISRILVVTFTKAAASELVSRISDALNEALAENPDNRHIRSQSLLVSSAQISTIHSFCLDLIRTNFQKLDIPADFSPGSGAEVELFMKSIAEELISDYFEGDLLPGEIPIAQFERFADTFGDVTRTDKLKEVMVELYESMSATLDFLELPDRFASMARKAAKEGFSGSIWEREIRRYLTDFLFHYRTVYTDALQHIDDHEELTKYRPIFASEWEEITSLLSDTEKSCDYFSLAEALGRHSVTRLPVVRGVGDDQKMNFYKEARADFHKELKKLTEEAFSFSKTEIERVLFETADMLDALSVFLKTFDKRFTAEKHRRHIITFGDMERLALSLLWDREQDAPTDLARAMQDAYDEIYIDEYQDTNEIQDKIFTLISKENNRFHVGDIKQSIYAFRGAEPSIFERLLRDRPKYEKDDPDPAVKIYLSENFRSSAEILGFCNTIFEKLMNTERPRYGEDERLNCGSGKHAPLPELYLLPKASEDDEQEDTVGEAEFVAEKIASLLSKGKKADGSAIKPSDIVILLRSTSSSSAAYESALKSHGIPCRNAAALSFFESPEVLLMLSLLSAIDNPRRDVPLAAALKSPLYGVTLDELLFIRRHQKNVTLMEALRSFTEETGFAKGRRFLQDLERYAHMAEETPCDGLIWQIYGDTAIFSILAADRERPLYETEQARANLITLYDYARSFERGGFKGLSGFISFLNEVLENKTKMDISQFSSPGDVVNIMTIHKSKGLEFPICFVSETGKRFHLPEAREKTIFDRELGISTKLSTGGGLFRLESPLRTASVLNRKSNAVEEELRILYVALTRAKERLIVTGSVPRKAMEEGLYDIHAPFSAYAMKNRYFSAYALRRAPSYLELMLTALANQDGFSITTPKGKNDESPKEEVEMPIEAEASDDGMTLYEAKKLVHERLSFVYPYKHLLGIPSKLSVSKLHPAVLDGTEEGVKEEVGEIPPLVGIPQFLRNEPDDFVTAAERGTATHTFMQFCDFEAVRTHGLEKEIERLVSAQFLFRGDAEKIDKKCVAAFFESALAAEMFASTRLYREKRFMIRYPASLFTEKTDKTLLKNETLLVQGVIDCVFFDAKDELILVDYKTDHFPRGTKRDVMEKTLRERHARQLGYYAYACKELFGVKPHHIYIYAFALNGTVEINL